MSEQALKKFFHGHAVHDEAISQDLKSASSLDDFAEKLAKHGQAHDHSFTAEHVKETVKKEHAVWKASRERVLTDQELQSVAGGSTIVLCIGGAMAAGEAADGAADEIESGAWKI